MMMMMNDRVKQWWILLCNKIVCFKTGFVATLLFLFGNPPPSNDTVK